MYFDVFREFNDASSVSNRRISPIVTLISVISAVIDIDDLPNYPITQSHIKKRVLDTVYRGEESDINFCLSFLEKFGYVNIDRTLIRKNFHNQYRFSEKLLNSISDFANRVTKVYSIISNEQPSHGALEHAKVIFDYFCFRFLPEWYLLIKRILRSSGNTEESKQGFYDGLFRVQSWITVNFFLSWLQSNPPDRRVSVFSRELAERTEMGSEEAANLISELAQTGFFFGGVPLRLDANTRVHVEEYQRAITADYLDFLNTLGRVGKEN